MHQLHKRLTGAANSSIEIIIAWSELLQMRKRLFVRNWIRRLLRYLCIPVGFFLVVVPLYSLMIRQTIQAQSSSAMEKLAIGTTPVGAMPEQHPQYNEQIVQRNGVYSACQQL